MSLAFPQLKVGEPIRHESLSVFPLFSDVGSDIDYRLADEALGDESAVVTEVSESGSVPELFVENKGKTRILFLEGEELVGAKQNRILNTSVLVAAGSTVKIPVSCVEQGRWRYRSAHFACSGSHSSSKLRAVLKGSVGRAMKEKRGHRSDQAAVWKAVSDMQTTLGVDSDTSAMSDVFSAYEKKIEELRERVQYVPEAIGFAIAIGKKIIMFDVFDKPATCERVWSRVLSGVIFDALEAGEVKEQSTAAEIEQFLGSARDMAWEQSDAVGEGEEYRSESESGEHGSALAFEDAVVHGSVVTAQ